MIPSHPDCQRCAHKDALQRASSRRYYEKNREKILDRAYWGRQEANGGWPEEPPPSAYWQTPSPDTTPDTPLTHSPGASEEGVAIPPAQVVNTSTP